MKIISITASDGISRVAFVPERGGAACSIVMLGTEGPRELLYLHDAFWNSVISDLPGGWPFCFPICGRLERQGVIGAYLYDARIYHLPIHGFSWNEAWALKNHSDDQVILVLRDNPRTRAMYPFSFEVTLDYRIHPNKLVCRQSFRNLSERPMPYCAGFHPYFMTPPAGEGKDKVILDYDPVRRFKYNERLTDLVGELEVFSVPCSISNPEIHEQLTQVGDNKKIVLRYPKGDAISLTTQGEESPDFYPYVQVYSPPEKNFICVEPWTSAPNALNSVAGVRWLEPMCVEYAVLELELVFNAEFDNRP